MDALDAPRVVWAMVPAGDPTEAVVTQLGDLLDEGDVVVDGGNSNWRDSVRRGRGAGEAGHRLRRLRHQRRRLGPTEGYCLMVGGDDDHVAAAQPLFDALVPPEGGGFVHAGRVGTGHFTKMVHNGIEYGLMQSYAEGYELLTRSGLDIDVVGALDAWRERLRGAVLAARPAGQGARGDARPRRRRGATPPTRARAAGRCRRRSSGACPRR